MGNTLCMSHLGFLLYRVHIYYLLTRKPLSLLNLLILANLLILPNLLNFLKLSILSPHNVCFALTHHTHRAHLHTSPLCVFLCVCAPNPRLWVGQPALGGQYFRRKALSRGAYSPSNPRRVGSISGGKRPHVARIPRPPRAP